ncbi:hypothetical protein [Mycetocola miduiensis]|uniref:Uncharacterized protein n=1 Tax=Mycetocola miduiensis TaxID=995034 RepID=A0A1I4Z323_9MICO|nr:hypothetical protein [Mycetocola miduiensis]SFN44598.1 hypothetical protein SAMN05216219_0697 [Mycetocola miduiensis]
MQISGEYGTELLLRYTEEQLSRDLERRRIGNERQAETPAKKRHPRGTMRARLAALLAGEGMPVGRQDVGVSAVHAAHR